MSKITPDHAAQLRAAYAIGAARIPGLAAYMARDASIPRIAAAKDRAMRHRWDALNASRAVAPLADLTRAIYVYANDEHIDTVLRAAQREVSP
jgi:hypothetical protein